MTPKEKAIELVNKFSNYAHKNTWDKKDYCAIECASIAVDEILSTNPSYIYWDTYDDETPSAVTYWNEVKSEIEKL